MDYPPYKIILNIFFISFNCILYNLIITLRNAFYINYIYDLLIINLAIMLLVNFHWKFWFLYLILPGYGVIKLGMYLFEYTKTIGQADPNEVAAPQGLNSKKREKPKKFLALSSVVAVLPYGVKFKTTA